MTNALARGWRGFWFARTRRHPLGAMRALLCAWCVVEYVPQVLLACKRDAVLDPALYHWNLGSRLTLLDYPPTGAALTGFIAGLYVAGLCAAVGLCTRLALAVFGLGLLYAFSGFASHDFFNHEQVLTVQVLLILAIAPGSTAWSADRALRVWRFARRRASPALQPTTRRRLARHLQGPAVPRWGVQLVLVLFVLVYTTAGLSKLRFSGGRWLNGQTIRYYMDGTQLAERRVNGQLYFGDPSLAGSTAWKDGAGLVDHGYGYTAHWLFRKRLGYPWPYALIATGTVLFELSAVALLLGPRLRNVYLVGAFAMHTGIHITMGLPFNDYRLLILTLISYPLLWRQATWPWRWWRGRGASA